MKFFKVCSYYICKFNKSNKYKYEEEVQFSKALNGAAVVTRLGNDVIINYKAGNKLFVTIKSKVGRHMDRRICVNLDGTSHRHEHDDDLFMV